MFTINKTGATVLLELFRINNIIYEIKANRVTVPLYYSQYIELQRFEGD